MMFGLAKLHRQRERFYEQTKALESLARESRQQYVSQSLQKAASPAGLALSFMLGLTTQCESAKWQRNLLLASARNELITVWIQQLKRLTQRESET